jgi:hypothetical protein
MEKKRLGSHPLDWIKDTREEKGKGKKKTRETSSQHDSKTEIQQNSINPRKATYYIRPELIKGLKYLGADTERDLSDLVNEAIEGLLSKHKQKTV